MQPYLTTLEQLYAEYRHSLPSANESGQDNSLFFRALPYNRLTIHDVTFGTPREEARLRLDTHIISGITQGILHPWPFDGYFWQSPNDPTLVLLRDVILYYADKHQPSPPNP